MSNLLGSIFGFGNKMKRRLRDAVSNPSDYAEMTADENRNEWRKNPDERSLGFFNPVPLGTLSNFTMRKELGDAVANLSRRDFLKKSAGLAGGTAAASIPGAKLLQKFAPEERAIAKEAVTEAAPKYKYNSLKEYLDDVTDYSHDIGHERAYESAMEHGYNNHPGADRYMDDFVDNFDFSKIQKKRLLRDEEAYNTAKFFYKDNLKDPTTGKWIDPFTGKPHSEEFLRNIRNNIEDFSPQAKKEMKAWKRDIYERFNNQLGFESHLNDPRVRKHYTLMDEIDQKAGGWSPETAEEFAYLRKHGYLDDSELRSIEKEHIDSMRNTPLNLNKVNQTSPNLIDDAVNNFFGKPSFNDFPF